MIDWTTGKLQEKINNSVIGIQLYNLGNKVRYGETLLTGYLIQFLSYSKKFDSTDAY